MKKIIIFCLVVALCWLALPNRKITSDQKIDFSEFANQIMQERAIPAMAVARIKDGQLIFSQAYGYADVAQKKLATTSTLFNIASISKPIMGLVLLQLVDQNRLSLDSDINNYLPFKVDNPHVDGETITLRQLATHTSSIDDYYCGIETGDCNFETIGVNKDPQISLQDYIKSLLTPTGEHYQNGAHYLASAPGKARRYSNLAAGVAGLLVESVTGETLAAYSRSHLFPSLDIKTASWRLNDLNLTDVAVPYEVNQCIPYLPVCADTESPKMNTLISRIFNPPMAFKHFEAYPHLGNPQYPDGGVRISISDLGQLLTSVLNNRDANGEPLLSDKMYKEMFILQLAPELSDSQRFFWRDRDGLTGHMGSDLGVFTAMYFDIQSKDGYIVLMNRGIDDESAQAMKMTIERLEKMI